MALLPSEGFYSSLMFRSSLSLPCTRTRPSTSLKFLKLRTPSARFTSTKSTTTPLCFETAPSSSFYEVLGVPMSATSHEIKAAYRKLARLSHPDVASYDKKEKSAEDFIKIHTAYSALSDPVTRANYDHNLHKVQWSFSPASASAVATRDSRYATISRRKWETDQCW